MDESLLAQGGPFTTLKNFANSLTHFLFQYKIQFNIVQLLWNFETLLAFSRSFVLSNAQEKKLFNSHLGVDKNT